MLEWPAEGPQIVITTGGWALANTHAGWLQAKKRLPESSLDSALLEHRDALLVQSLLHQLLDLVGPGPGQLGPKLSSMSSRTVQHPGAEDITSTTDQWGEIATSQLKHEDGTRHGA